MARGAVEHKQRLRAIAVMLVAFSLLACVIWTSRSSAAPGAGNAPGVLANPAQERQQMVSQLEDVNNRLGRIEHLLSSGAIRVQLADPSGDGGQHRSRSLSDDGTNIRITPSRRVR